MLDNSLFSHLLQKISTSYTHKEKIQSILKECGIKNSFTVKGTHIQLQDISSVQKRELFLKKESIEQKIQQEVGKKYVLKVN